MASTMSGRGKLPSSALVKGNVETPSKPAQIQHGQRHHEPIHARQPPTRCTTLLVTKNVRLLACNAHGGRVMTTLPDVQAGDLAHLK